MLAPFLSIRVLIIVGGTEPNDAEDFRGGLARVHVGGEFRMTNDGPAYWDGGIWYYANAQGFVVSVCHRDGEPADALGHEWLSH